MRIVWDAGVRGSHLKDKSGKSCDRNILQKVKVSDIIEIMKSLNEDLKTGQFKQIYLLYGEENYLKKQYKERFVKAMLPDGDTMNYAYYEGKGVDIKEVIDLAETLPFFAERRLLVFENTGFFKARGWIWQIMLRKCLRPHILFLWRKRWTSAANCIRQ